MVVQVDSQRAGLQAELGALQPKAVVVERLRKQVRLGRVAVVWA